LDLRSGVPPGGWSPITDFSGQTENAGHFLQPAITAMGQRVIDSSQTAGDSSGCRDSTTAKQARGLFSAALLVVGHAGHEADVPVELGATKPRESS
jgi:hypothetical protein